MSSEFSWAERVHVAVNACLPCLYRTPSNDSLTNPTPRSRTTPPDHLRRLLADPESDSALDSETLSLHSNPGLARRARKSKQSGARSSRHITLFGFHLFGRPSPPPIQLPDDHDDALYRPAATGPITPTLTVHSTATFDSDAAPLDADAIDNLSGSAAAALAEAEEEERRQKEERRRRRRERREMKKMARALAASGDGEFEGFQGSGDGYPAIPPPFLHQPQHEQQPQPQPQQPPSPTSLLPHLAMTQEEDDESADLDGVIYTRRRAPPNASNGGSDSRSRTSTSLSDRHAAAGYQQQYPYPYPTPTKSKAKSPSSSTPTKTKKKSKSTSSHTSSHHRPKSTRSSNSNSYTNTDSTSLASPTSPNSFFPDDSNTSITTVTVVSPSTVEQGQGFFDLEDQQEVRVPTVPQFTKSPNETARVSAPEREAFPSTGFGLGLGFSGKAKGAFLADSVPPSSGTRGGEDYLDGLY